MSLKDRYRTNSRIANSSVWFDFTESPNPDGSIPGFKLARKTGQNKAYLRAMRDSLKDYEADGALDMTLLSEEEAQEIELNVFVGSLLIDWRNFQPDKDGENVEFSKAEARRIFGDPDWMDLMSDLVRKCSQASAYKIRELEVAKKNS